MCAKRRCAAVFSGSIDGGEARDPEGARAVGQRDAERRAQALALVAVADDDRDLGGVRMLGVAHPAPDAGHGGRVVGQDGDERVVVDVVDLGQVAQLGQREAVLGREEAQARAPRRERRHPAHEQSLVIGRDGPDEDSRTVAQANIHATDGTRDRRWRA